MTTTPKSMTSEPTPPAKTEEWEEKIKLKIAGISGILNGSAVGDTGQAIIAEQKLGDILDLLPKLIAQTRSQAYEKGYTKGFVSCMVADGTKLKKMYKEGRREAIEEVKAVFAKHKEEPMTGNVVLLELDVLLDALKGKEKV